jgi:hypothetical protein
MADPRMINALREDLYPGEDSYFKENPNVAGMASESGHVILNPYSGPDVNQDAVYQNELARLYMRGQLPNVDQVRPAFDLTNEQMQSLPPEYQSAPIQDQRETIAARIYSGDPSAGIPTGDQKAFADAMRRALVGNQ